MAGTYESIPSPTRVIPNAEDFLTPAAIGTINAIRSNGVGAPTIISSDNRIIQALLDPTSGTKDASYPGTQSMQATLLSIPTSPTAVPVNFNGASFVLWQPMNEPYGRCVLMALTPGTTTYELLEIYQPSVPLADTFNVFRCLTIGGTARATINNAGGAAGSMTVVSFSANPNTATFNWRVITPGQAIAAARDPTNYRQNQVATNGCFFTANGPPKAFMAEVLSTNSQPADLTVFSHWQSLVGSDVAYNGWVIAGVLNATPYTVFDSNNATDSIHANDYGPVRVTCSLTAFKSAAVQVAKITVRLTRSHALRATHARVDVDRDYVILPSADVNFSGTFNDIVDVPDGTTDDAAGYYGIITRARVIVSNTGAETVGRAGGGSIASLTISSMTLSTSDMQRAINYVGMSGCSLGQTLLFNLSAVYEGVPQTARAAIMTLQSAPYVQQLLDLCSYSLNNRNALGVPAVVTLTEYDTTWKKAYELLSVRNVAAHHAASLPPWLRALGGVIATAAPIVGTAFGHPRVGQMAGNALQAALDTKSAASMGGTYAASYRSPGRLASASAPTYTAETLLAGARKIGLPFLDLCVVCQLRDRTPEGFAQALAEGSIPSSVIDALVHSKTASSMTKEEVHAAIDRAVHGLAAELEANPNRPCPYELFMHQEAFLGFTSSQAQYALCNDLPGLSIAWIDSFCLSMGWTRNADMVWTVQAGRPLATAVGELASKAADFTALCTAVRAEFPDSNSDTVRRALLTHGFLVVDNHITPTATVEVDGLTRSFASRCARDGQTLAELEVVADKILGYVPPDLPQAVECSGFYIHLGMLHKRPEAKRASSQLFPSGAASAVSMCPPQSAEVSRPDIASPEVSSQLRSMAVNLTTDPEYVSYALELQKYFLERPATQAYKLKDLLNAQTSSRLSCVYLGLALNALGYALVDGWACPVLHMNESRPPTDPIQVDRNSSVQGVQGPTLAARALMSSAAPAEPAIPSEPFYPAMTRLNRLLEVYRINPPTLSYEPSADGFRPVSESLHFANIKLTATTKKAAAHAWAAAYTPTVERILASPFPFKQNCSFDAFVQHYISQLAAAGPAHRDVPQWTVPTPMRASSRSSLGHISPAPQLPAERDQGDFDRLLEMLGAVKVAAPELQIEYSPDGVRVRHPSLDPPGTTALGDDESDAIDFWAARHRTSLEQRANSRSISLNVMREPHEAISFDAFLSIPLSMLFSPPHRASSLTPMTNEQIERIIGGGAHFYPAVEQHAHLPDPGAVAALSAPQSQAAAEFREYTAQWMPEQSLGPPPALPASSNMTVPADAGFVIKRALSSAGTAPPTGKLAYDAIFRQCCKALSCASPSAPTYGATYAPVVGPPPDTIYFRALPLPLSKSELEAQRLVGDIVAGAPSYDYVATHFVIDGFRYAVYLAQSEIALRMCRSLYPSQMCFWDAFPEQLRLIVEGGLLPAAGRDKSVYVHIISSNHCVGTSAGAALLYCLRGCCMERAGITGGYLERDLDGEKQVISDIIIEIPEKLATCPNLVVDPVCCPAADWVMLKKSSRRWFQDFSQIKPNTVLPVSDYNAVPLACLHDIMLSSAGPPLRALRVRAGPYEEVSSHTVQPHLDNPKFSQLVYSDPYVPEFVFGDDSTGSDPAGINPNTARKAARKLIATRKNAPVQVDLLSGQQKVEKLATYAKRAVANNTSQLNRKVVQTFHNPAAEMQTPIMPIRMITGAPHNFVAALSRLRPVQSLKKGYSLVDVSRPTGAVVGQALGRLNPKGELVNNQLYDADYVGLRVAPSRAVKRRAAKGAEGLLLAPLPRAPRRARKAPVVVPELD